MNPQLTIDSIKTSYIKDGIESEIVFDPDFIKEYIKIEDTENPLIKKLS
jgi:UDP-glucose 6-dehydrogenase